MELPRIGVVRTHESTRTLARHVERGTARIRSATVSYRAGRWFCSFSVEIERHDPGPAPARPDSVVGVDLGVKAVAVLSTGEVIANPRHLATARSWSTTSGVAGMLKNRRLARHIAGVGMGELRRQLEANPTAGGRVVVADRWYPSSTTCSACGAVKTKLRLAERTYHCDQCGLVADRDPGAARNLAPLVDQVSGRHVLPKLAWATVNEPEGDSHKTRTTRAAGTATGRPTPAGAGQRRRGNAPTQDTFLHVF